MSTWIKLWERDCYQLTSFGYKFHKQKEDMSVFLVEFVGPANSLYEGHMWDVEVKRQDDYPLRAPSLVFMTKIMHPNIEELSGAVDAGVFDRSYSPWCELVNIFKVFLPKLLLNPNPKEPWNPTAAALMISDYADYEHRVKEHCQKYAVLAKQMPERKELQKRRRRGGQGGQTDKKKRVGSSDEENTVNSLEEGEIVDSANDTKGVGSADDKEATEGSADDKKLSVGSPDETSDFDDETVLNFLNDNEMEDKTVRSADDKDETMGSPVP